MKHIYTLLTVVASVALSAVASAQCTVSFTHSENGLTISASSTGTGVASFPTYVFDWGDGNVGIEQSGTHTYTTAGTYTVCAVYFDFMDTASCYATSCQDITIGSSASVKEIDEPLTISVYPNPAVNAIEISSNEPLETFYIYNTLGSVVYSDRVMATNTKVTITDFPKGVYLLRCNGMTKRFVKK